MNRRNLLKKLCMIPLAALGMNKTLAAIAAPAKDDVLKCASKTATGTAELNRILNERLDNIALSLNSGYVRIKGNLVVVENETFYFPEAVKSVQPYKNGYAVITENNTYTIQRTDVGFYTHQAD